MPAISQRGFAETEEIFGEECGSFHTAKSRERECGQVGSKSGYESETAEIERNNNINWRVHGSSESNYIL